MIRRLAAHALVFALALGACDDGPSAPPSVPGTLTVRLISPNGAEGAAILEVDAEAVDHVTAVEAEAYAVNIGDRMRIVLIRPTGGEIRARLAVTDTAAELDARVLEVADSANAKRPSLDGYEVEVSP